MANKYPVQVRMKEMSKQEEILAKRKREIEKRMKEEAGGGSTPPEGPPPKKHTVNPPLPPVAPRPRPSSSVSPGIQVPNKFNNDGSFLEQFKKLAKKEPDIKDEKPFFTDKSRGVKPLPTPKVKMLSQVPSPPLRLGPTSTSTSALQQVKIENDLEKERCGDEGPKAEVEPDWFQDALKRAQAKAKELLEGPPVSLSACPSVDDSSKSLAGKKRRSRWGDKTDPETSPAHHVPPAAATPPPATPATPATTSSGPPSVCLSVPESLMDMIGEGEHMQAIQGIMVTRLTRSNPAIISYAHKVFGSLDLSEAQWRQCEEQMKMNVVYQLLQAKKQEAERLEQQGKVKYEYDSDEDVEGGTWEHKRRAMEMQETQAKAVELTSSAEGKHHIGDFLPPDELARFMEKYRAIKEGRDPDLSDYQEHKLTEENVGYRMLKSMGWTEGMGLGAEGKGITAPVNQNGRSESQGLGVDRPDSLGEEDDEYDAYRKRMMLAYRFRPNPLNNPRRAYY